MEVTRHKQTASRGIEASVEVTSKITSKTKNVNRKRLTGTAVTTAARPKYKICDDRKREKRRLFQRHKERREGHMKDALALGGEEGRDKLR